LHDFSNANVDVNTVQALRFFSLASIMSARVSMSSSIATETTLPEKRWKNVATRVAIDAATAMTAAVTVSPLVATVDK
jgi:hypothetical protein